MKRRTRDPVRDAKTVVEKMVSELSTDDIFYYLGRKHDVDADNILDIIESATVSLRWEG